MEVITSAPQCVVFENNPHIDKLSISDKKYIPQDSSGNWQNYFVGRGLEYDAFYHLSHSVETVGALFTGQTQFYWPHELRKKFCFQNYLERIHDICEVPYKFGPLFFPTDAEKEKAAETKKVIGEKCIGWVISGTRLDKIHPYAGMIIAQLIREVAPVVVLGAPGKNFESAAALQEDCRRFNGNDTGFFSAVSPASTPDEQDPRGEKKFDFPIRRLLTLSQACDLIITPDTGPAWATAFEPNKKVLMVSHASHENIGKHWKNTVTLQADAERVPCFPCHQLHEFFQGDPNRFGTCTPNKEKSGAACITDISTQCVITAAKAAWGDKPSQKKLFKYWASNVASPHGEWTYR